MKRVVVSLLSVLLLTAALPAAAAICTVDAVPAATLLLPYFEVDLDSGGWGAKTLFSINNASASAVLAHVVIWSDLSVPVLDFNIYLTGYDVQTVNLYDIIVNGNLPQTASAGQDPADTISPKGKFSQDVNFASCQGNLPIPQLPATFTSHLQAALTGQFSNLLGGCAGLDYGDRLARGYVTVDTVSNCTLRFPGDLGYFASGGSGDATNQNVLWGDAFYVKEVLNYASGNPLVHVEASATNPETSVAGQYTFYGRYVGWTAADNREPLATEFATRFTNGGPFSGGTDLVVWRDSKVSQGAFKCGTLPAWYPLGQEAVVFFDEQEHNIIAQVFPVSPQPHGPGIIPFPAEAQRTHVGGPALPVPYNFGWFYFDLNTAVTAAGNVPPEDPVAAQAWMSTLMQAAGRYSVGFDAIQLDSACRANHAFPR
ncbi:MAG TPA: hypothetical protein VFE33_24815 [Thermoanaerobaculia bacterium]|nr:hypothetical protein [Thermoanaerobaculia bacterium]